MGGLVKGIKKVFKAVGNIVKKYWKPILIAAAVYFTAGIALAAMPATASFAAAMPGFGAGGIFSSAATAIGIGDASSVAAGTGLWGNAVASSAVAAAGGAGTTALAAGEGATETTAEVGFASGSGEAATAGYTLPSYATDTAAAATGDMGGAGVLAAGTPQATIDAAAAGNIAGATPQAASFNVVGNDPATSGISKFAGPNATYASSGTATPASDTGFFGGMSGAEKAMFAATAFKGIAGLLQPGPTRAQQGLWPGGAYFGMDEKGKGTDLGAVYKNAMTGSNDTTDLSAESSGVTLPGAAPATSAPLAAGGGQAPAQPQQPSPAASAQTGSAFLPTAGQGAATAQQTTLTQSDALQKSSQSNADFIQSTMDRLDPRKRNANST
jgi:hypothetical protein